MQLYILRHGAAEDGNPGQPDSARHLTDEGRRKLALQRPFFESLGVELDYIFSSPYPRAAETARIVAPAFGCSVTESNQLKPGCSLEDVEELLAGYDFPRRCMIVGHQPDLGQIVSVLTGASVAMRKGMLAIVETGALRPAHGTLMGLYDPDVIAANDLSSRHP